MSEQTKTNWTINALLAVILALLAGHYVSLVRPAQAAGGGWETDGVVAMTSSGAQERLVIVDTKKSNIMLYKAQGNQMFRLVGARSYQYDVELEDTDGSPEFHGAGITFAKAKELYDKTHQR